MYEKHVSVFRPIGMPRILYRYIFKEICLVFGISLVTFTKWGGFFRLTETMRREYPHEVLDEERELLVPYECGILF